MKTNLFVKNDLVKIKAEFADDCEKDISFICVDDEEKGRVTIMALIGLTINPTQVVKTEWIDVV